MSASLDVNLRGASGTYQAAVESVDVALTAVDELLRDGDSAASASADPRVIFALCRPPGHHAPADMYGGYCFLNNAGACGRVAPLCAGDGG